MVDTIVPNSGGNGAVVCATKTNALSKYEQGLCSSYAMVTAANHRRSYTVDPSLFTSQISGIEEGMTEGEVMGVVALYDRRWMDGEDLVFELEPIDGSLTFLPAKRILLRVTLEEGVVTGMRIED